MVTLVRNLEPRHENPGRIIFRTVEEVNEIFFIESGSVDIGFEINRDSKYVLRLFKGGCIGAYNVTFSTKTAFIYKVSQSYTGLTIRKQKWLNLLGEEEYLDLAKFIKNKVRKEYEAKIKTPV
jgi:CRP-like cAMP-binding protein